MVSQGRSGGSLSGGGSSVEKDWDEDEAEVFSQTQADVSGVPDPAPYAPKVPVVVSAPEPGVSRVLPPWATSVPSEGDDVWRSSVRSVEELLATHRRPLNTFRYVGALPL